VYAAHLASFLRPELGLFAGGIVEASHRYACLLDASEDRVFRVTFTNGDIFRLRQWSQIAPSTYGDPDGWCATVVEIVRASEPKKKRLFRPGSGVDILESDISEIFDEANGSIVHPA
jgi:hypothetical protein